MSDESETGGQCGSTSRSVSKRGCERRGETRGTSHRLSGERGRAAKRVVAGASIKHGVTKCVRVCWGRQGRRGGKRVLIVVQSGEGGAKPHRARQTQRGSAPRRRLHFKCSRTSHVSSYSACYGDIRESISHQVCGRVADGIDWLCILFLALVAMTNKDSNLPGGRDLRCVAATAKGPDLRIIKPTEIRASYGECAGERDNNYFRTAEWYATR